MSINTHDGDDRLSDLLARTASGARSPRPWGVFVVDARKSLRRQRTFAVALAAGLIGLGVGFAMQIDGFDLGNKADVPGPAGAPTSTAGSTPPDTEAPERDEVCDFPEERPTYLPWLAEGEEVGEPIKSSADPGDKGSDFASLLWPRTEGDPDSDYVSLFRQSDGGEEGYGEPVYVFLGDAMGRFEIAPGEGDATILWLTGSGRCNVTVLTLRTADWSDTRLEEEIRKVARSLVGDRVESD